ncbi:MAG: YihY/virulence factor BrkB family protein [Gemmatimonadales bacterium]
MVAADENNIPFLASALTFDALLAAIPFLLLMLIGLTHLAELSAAASDVDLNRVLERFLPPHSRTGGQDPFAAVERMLTAITRNRGTLSLYAAPLFLWFSTRLFAGIRISLNEVFDVSARPIRRHFLVGFLLAKLRDVGMVMATVVLFAANTALSAGLGVLEARGSAALASIPLLSFLVTSLGRFLAELLAFLFGVTLFFLIYKHASLRRLPWQAALLASTFTALAFEVLKRLFGFYLQYMASLERLSANANIGALILFVVWLYYTAIVFLYGGVVAETWDLRQRQQRQRAVLA